MAVISNGTTLIDNGILDAAVPSGKLNITYLLKLQVQVLQYLLHLA
jgi:hypothetical protein